MKPVLDLTKYHDVITRGELTVWFTWYGAEWEDMEPCLAITPTYRTGSDKSKACVVVLSNLYLYDNPQNLLTTAMRFAQAMGMEDTMTTVHRIADVIYDHLDDLCYMPERPSYGAYTAATATVTTEDGKQHEFEIKDHR